MCCGTILQCNVMYSYFLEYLMFQLSHPGSTKQLWKLRLHPYCSRCSIWLNEDVQYRINTLQFNHLTPRHISCLDGYQEHFRERSWWCEFASFETCVSAKKDERTEPAILSADAMSPFSGMTLKEVCPLFPPWHSPSLEQDRRHVQIPKHSSIKTFWLLTRPQKMVDMCRL